MKITKHESRIVSMLAIDIVCIVLGYYTTEWLLIVGIIITMLGIAYFQFSKLMVEKTETEPFKSCQWRCYCGDFHSNITYGCRECGEYRDNHNRTYYLTENKN